MYTLMTDLTTSKTLTNTRAQPLDAALYDSLRADASLQIDTPLLFLCPRSSAKQDYCQLELPRNAFLGSDRLQTIFAQTGVSYRAHPAVLLHPKSRDVLSTTHKFIIIQQIDLNDCMDWQNSQIWTDPDMKMRILTTLVLKKDFQSQAVPAFCVRPRSTFLVHDTVREEIIRQKLKGIAFVSLTAFFAPSLGLDEQRLRAKLARDTHQAGVWYELALILMQLFHYPEACEAIEQVLSLQETYPRAYYMYGTLLSRLGEPEKALEAYQEEMRTSPEHFGWQEYCELLYTAGRNEEAVKVALHYLDEPFWQHIRRGWYHLSMAYLRLQRFEEALAACEQAFLWRGSPREDFLYLTKGHALFGLQRFEEALECYEQGLQWSGASLQLWQAKEAVLRALNRMEAAREAHDQVEFWEAIYYKRLHEGLS